MMQGLKYVDGQVEQVEQVGSKFMERLKGQDYELEQNAVLKGKSGAEHTLDILARKNHGFISYIVAIGIIEHDNGREVNLGEVVTFDDKCYDCGIRDKLLIAIPKLESIANRFAEARGIKVFDKESAEALLLSPPPAKQVAPSLPASFKTKLEFSQTLTALGYKVEEKARVRGKSGAEYIFDILAEQDEGFVVHRVGIDEVVDDEVSLNQVSLFDTKSYDAGIYNKVLLSSGKLAPEASQFAQQQRIRVIELDNSAPKSAVVEEAAEPGEDTSIQSVVEELLAQAPEEKREKRLLRRKPQPEALQLIPEAMARRFNTMPLAVGDNSLQVAMANPADIFALEALALQSRMRIEPITADEKEIREAIDFYYKGLGQIQEQISRIPRLAEGLDEADLIEATADAPVASALRLMIDEATRCRASDIHIEPQEDRLRIRFRIDGALQDIMSLPLNIHPALTSRVKIMAEMNIADHLRPQDGQFSVQAKGRTVDIRVATSPTVYGETTTLRLLDKALAVMDLTELGFLPDALAKYEDMLKVPFGMILVSGPTGAGKTTTLYASVNKLDKTSRNIVTIEDPVEYRFENMNQIQVNPRAGVTFANGLRSILRLDPDVILVGEVRDAETARIAIQAALTGHLVLASIHANDAVGVIFRLLDLGIEPFLASSAVIGVVAQRMVRRSCLDCSIYKEAPFIEQLAYRQATGEDRAKFLHGAGCELCSYTGYRGRTGIFEVLPLSDNIRMQILNHASTSEIRQQAMKEGMVPLIKDGMLKVKEGITTPAEVLRNAYFIE